MTARVAETRYEHISTTERKNGVFRLVPLNHEGPPRTRFPRGRRADNGVVVRPTSVSNPEIERAAETLFLFSRFAVARPTFVHYSTKMRIGPRPVRGLTVHTPFTSFPFPVRPESAAAF